MVSIIVITIFNLFRYVVNICRHWLPFKSVGRRHNCTNIVSLVVAVVGEAAGLVPHDGAKSFEHSFPLAYFSSSSPTFRWTRSIEWFITNCKLFLLTKLKSLPVMRDCCTTMKVHCFYTLLVLEATKLEWMWMPSTGQIARFNVQNSLDYSNKVDWDFE